MTDGNQNLSFWEPVGSQLFDSSKLSALPDNCANCFCSLVMDHFFFFCSCLIGKLEIKSPLWKSWVTLGSSQHPSAASGYHGNESDTWHHETESLSQPEQTISKMDGWCIWIRDVMPTVNSFILDNSQVHKPDSMHIYILHKPITPSCFTEANPCTTQGFSQIRSMQSAITPTLNHNS